MEHGSCIRTTCHTEGASRCNPTRPIANHQLTILPMPDSRPFIAVVQLVHQPIGGVQSVMLQLLPRLLGQFRIVVLDPYGNDRFAEQCRAAGLETAVLGPPPRTPYIGGKGTMRRPLLVLRRAPRMALMLVKFRRWVRENRVAAVWFNQLPALRHFGRALPRGGPPLIYHAHGFASAAEIGLRTARWLSRRAAAVVAVSRVTADFLVEAGVTPGKVRIIYNAIDAERVHMLAKQDGPPLPERPSGGVVFLHAATLNREKKAQHLAIEALGVVNRPDAQLWICGDVGPEEDRRYVDELHRLVARLGLRSRVHFLGWRRDLARVIDHADVTMLTSICPSESFGMVLVEAMALGKPCIATTIGGPPEVIAQDETGLLAEPRPSAIAEAMSALAASSELRARMGRTGMARADSVFSLSRQAAEFSAILKTITAARTG